MTSNNNTRLWLELYRFLLARRNLFCAACNLDIQNPPIHTCCEDQFTAVLLDPITDSLADYLVRVIDHEELVGLTINHIRGRLLRLHRDLLRRISTQQPTAPVTSQQPTAPVPIQQPTAPVPMEMEIVDLTTDDHKVNYTLY